MSETVVHVGGDDLASLAETWRVRSDRLIRWAGDPAPQDADKVQFWLGAAAAYREAIADIDISGPGRKLLPTPPPVPPWPGDENDDTARLSPDQGDRIVNACCRMLGCEPADIDGDAALEEILTEAVERCADLHGQDRWEDDCHGCGFRVGDHTTDGRCPAPAAPVPPWPGAVLSGLCDEDGEPTWLAQAPNVQGEAVRTCVDFPWFICGSDNAVTPYWVEVRAPRAVPEPETERERAARALRKAWVPNLAKNKPWETLSDEAREVYFAGVDAILAIMIKDSNR